MHDYRFFLPEDTFVISTMGSFLVVAMANDTPEHVLESFDDPKDWDKWVYKTVGDFYYATNLSNIKEAESFHKKCINKVKLELLNAILTCRKQGIKST